MNIESIKLIITATTSIITIILASLGLSTWRKKLWGENKFSLAIDSIKDMIVLIEIIKQYRNPFYTSGEIFEAYKEFENKELIDDVKEKNKANDYAEISRYKKIIEQYYKYNESMLKLKVILNKLDLDEINNKGIVYYIKEIRDKRSERQLYKIDSEEMRTMSDNERNEYMEKMKELGKVLNRSSKNDEFEMQLDKYYFELNKKLRKYLK